ncbi:hypothetical protein PPACK8108_LOCUS6879 [Phakopsora pachyrhizi]|uniref:Uncharacterized protein n=1 Tax=Phakopsora pachyrhizi TaxID=170000 RepID=A0AAV0ATL2_PHAPC|nr:hypothetical protein PPACK8108_LOCUS6879 [Phakopsora pachyrhizi]
MPRPRRNSLPAPFSPISSLPSNIGPPPSPHSGPSPALSEFNTESDDWMDGTNGFTAQNAKPAGSSRGPLVWCNPTIKAYGYEHPIARTPTEDMDSGVSSKGKSRLMVAVGIPSEQIVRAPRTSGGLAGIIEDAQEDLRNEVEPAIQKRKECMREVIDLEDQSQGTRSPSGERIRALPRTFDHPSEDVLEFENDKERARRLLVNTHRLLGAHVGKMVKGASNHRYSKFVQRGWEMDGLLTHAIKQLSDWYETLEVESYEGFEWDDSQGKRKAKDSP